MTKDQWEEVTFILGVKRGSRGLTTTGVWNKRGPENTEDNERLLEITLEIPASLWARPKMKGRLESRLEEDYLDWIRDVDTPKEEDDGDDVG